MHLWLYSLGRRYLDLDLDNSRQEPEAITATITYVDQIQSCRPEILYPQLVHDTPTKKEIMKNILQPTNQPTNQSINQIRVHL